MRARVCLILFASLALACGSSEEGFVGEVTAPVVYGADDRVEVFNHPDVELRRIAEQSIVALIPSFRMIRDPDGTYGLFTQALENAQELCPGELFGNQPTAAVCSGVLIDDDLVLTAGHCIDAVTPCDSYDYVFNYHLVAQDRLAVIRDADVYSCTRVVSQEAPESILPPDFAIVQLDRPVEGAKSPVVIRPATPLIEQESLTMIGFGSGLPAKIDSGGSVADPRASELDYFVANVDAFQGHSGAATFDSQNRLAGILIRGLAPDYVADSEDPSCNRVSVYEDSEAGEIIHNVAPIVASLCDAGEGAAALCDPTACEGEPCGSTPLPSDGPGGFPAPSADCSASTHSTGALSGWLGLALFVAVRRFRPRAA